MSKGSQWALLHNSLPWHQPAKASSNGWWFFPNIFCDFHPVLLGRWSNLTWFFFGIGWNHRQVMGFFVPVQASKCVMGISISLTETVPCARHVCYHHQRRFEWTSTCHCRVTRYQGALQYPRHGPNGVSAQRKIGHKQGGLPERTGRVQNPGSKVYMLSFVF